MSLATFWTQLLTEFWELSKQALKILMSFSATHLYRTGFSFIILIMINNLKSAQFEKWTYSSTASVTDILYIEKQLYTGKPVHCSDNYCDDILCYNATVLIYNVYTSI
jgi:hypothetical protein